MYTLKLDWTAQRIDHVLIALIPTLDAIDLHPVYVDLEPYLGVADPGATLKLTWSPELIDTVAAALDAYLTGSQAAIDRARDNRPGPSYELLVAMQASVHAAVREIREYRAAAAAVKAGERS